MRKRTKVIIFTIIMGIQFGFFGFQFLLLSEFDSQYNTGMSMRGANALIIAANSYYKEDLEGVKGYFDKWNCHIEIAGITANITSTEGNVTVTDFLVSELYDISFFDVVFIPGHKQIEELFINNTLEDELQDVNRENTVVAGIDNGTVVLASTGFVDGRKFVSHPFLAPDITTKGGVFDEEASVVTDDDIVTAVVRDYTVIDDQITVSITTNYEEMSYAIANSIDYSYKLDIDLSFNKEDSGWNYTLKIEPSDSHVISNMNISLFVSIDEIKTLVRTLDLNEHANIYTASLGILPNGYYSVDVTAESIYGTIETRTSISEFSVGGN